MPIFFGKETRFYNAIQEKIGLGLGGDGMRCPLLYPIFQTESLVGQSTERKLYYLLLDKRREKM